MDLQAPIAYLIKSNKPTDHLVYPAKSSRKTVRPEQEFHTMTIRDCRDVTEVLSLDKTGFELHLHKSETNDFYDEEEIRSHYYSEMQEFLKKKVGAEEVIVFDDNTRSAVRAKAGQLGVREPTQSAHVDYTISSGPRRCMEILNDAGQSRYRDNRMALINIWRPIVGPVEDWPLTVCDAQTTEQNDFVETNIHHFGEDDLENPRHSGQVFSLQHNVAHQWYFASHMQPNEVLFLKGYDSLAGRACFTPHTGFINPTASAGCTPRESIELRTLVIYPES